MLRRVLIANRGEVALRVICACRELGVGTVAVFSEIDAHSPHVRYADQAVCIGPAAASASYLNVAAIVSAAQLTGADAIHPGYGFLSESPVLAEAVEAAGLVYVGPSVEVLQLLGDKLRARRIMQDAGLSVSSGTADAPETMAAALNAAEGLGYPLMVKSVAGGGGRGIRLVHGPDELRQVWATAEREAESACGDGRLYLERLITPARHLEIQILADSRGEVVHLGERECSIQRRHQKLVEESPSVVFTASRREAVGAKVVHAASRLGYCGAGTFEFLMADSGELFFLEVNPRLQVEHPVTEMVTGVDIVKEQIRIASGAPLSIGQQDVAIRGHAIECRITAESPEGFRPSPGVIRSARFPGGPGVRVDSAVYDGASVSAHYDSLIAKLVTHGRDRTEAVARMRRALDMTTINGVSTTIPVHRAIISDPDFEAGRLSTDFVSRLGLAKSASGDG